MVDKRYLPLAFAMIVFEDEADVLHAYFGNWLRTFPKEILREMHNFLNGVRPDVSVVHAVADRNIEGSDKLIEWLGGIKTGKEADHGPIYEIDLTRSKI